MSGADTARRVLDAFNQHDSAAFAAYYAPDATVRDPQYPEPLRGREAIRKDMDEFFRGFPDMRANLRGPILEDGQTVSFEASFVGTQQGPVPGPLGEIPATGKRVEMNGAIFVRLDNDGRIAEERRYYDLAGMLGQLGVLGGPEVDVPLPRI